MTVHKNQINLLLNKFNEKTIVKRCMGCFICNFYNFSKKNLLNFLD